MKNQSVSTLTGVVIILLIALVAGVFVWWRAIPRDTQEVVHNPLDQAQNQDENTEKGDAATTQEQTWQTYTNNRAGYRFEYPVTRTFGIDETITYPNSMPYSENHDLVQFCVEDNCYSIRVRLECDENSVSCVREDALVQQGYLRTNLHGYTAYKLPGQAALVVIEGSTQYSITGHTGSTAPKSDSNDAVFKHILETFTLL